ncbi:MAG TPA: hypothetical protein VF184_01700 [Phycisphaeraceae bacterium]
MHSWVRYSVATYVGLLLAGALVVPPTSVTAGQQKQGSPRQSPLIGRPPSHPPQMLEECPTLCQPMDHQPWAIPNP